MAEGRLPVGDNPSLAMACNAYRRRYGAWPETIRFSPGHFAGYVSGLDQRQIRLLATVFEVVVTAVETSPRLTVLGAHGAITYGDGIEEADWDATPFHAWLSQESYTRGFEQS